MNIGILEQNQEKLRQELIEILFQQNITMQDLASEMGINYRTLRRFLKGEKTQLKTLISVAKYLRKKQ